MATLHELREITTPHRSFPTTTELWRWGGVDAVDLYGYCPQCRCGKSGDRRVPNDTTEACTGEACPCHDADATDELYSEQIPLVDRAGWLTDFGQRLYGAVEYRRRWYEAVHPDDMSAAHSAYLDAMEDVGIAAVVYSPAADAFLAPAEAWAQRQAAAS